MSKTTSSQWKHEAMLVFAVLVWGINFPIVKSVLAVMPPHVLNVFRFVVSAIVLGGLYAARRRRTGGDFFEPLRQLFWQIVGLGLLGFVLYQLSFIVGLDHTTAGNAALIMATAPLWTAVVGAAFGFERLNLGSWIGLGATLAGAVVVIVGGTGALTLSSDTFVGNLIMLAAALFWGMYTALSRPVLRRVSATGLSFLSLMFALPILFGIGAPYLDGVTWEEVTWITWAAILFSGGLSTGLAIALWNNAINRVGASHTAAYNNLVPFVALLASYVVLGEPVTVTQVAGGAFIVGGLFWMRHFRFRADTGAVTTRDGRSGGPSSIPSPVEPGAEP